MRERQAMAADWSFLGLRNDRQKLVLLYPKGRDPQPSLFDLLADPGERAPIDPPPLEAIERLSRRAIGLYETLKTEDADNAYREMDEVTSEALRSLGYVK